MDWLWKCPSAYLDVFGLFADTITAISEAFGQALERAVGKMEL